MNIFRISGLTADEILAEIENFDKAGTSADVFLLPPDEDDVTDEDSDDDEDTLPKDSNHLGRGILSQQAELVVYDGVEELPDIPEPQPSNSKRARLQQAEEDEDTEEQDQEDMAGDGPAQRLSRIKNKERRWSANQPNIFGMSVPDFQQQPLKNVPDSCVSPYDFFKLFVDDNFINEVVEASQRYAVRKNRPELLPKLTHDNIRLTHAIMYMTGYITPSNRRMYWERRGDTMNVQVKKAMSETTFSSIITNTAFVQRTEPDPLDRYWKVRPLFNQLNTTAKKWVQHPEKVSIDEGMVKYYGPHPLKQFMRGKPHRFGYKIWILASSTGELLACQPYGGSTTNIPDYGLGQGPNVIMGLSEQYGLLPGSKVYIFIKILLFKSFFCFQLIKENITVPYCTTTYFAKNCVFQGLLRQFIHHAGSLGPHGGPAAGRHGHPAPEQGHRDPPTNQEGGGEELQEGGGAGHLHPGCHRGGLAGQPARLHGQQPRESGAHGQLPKVQPEGEVLYCCAPAQAEPGIQ
jgi:hypothetical protein